MTRAGNAVFVVMDFSDIILAVSIARILIFDFPFSIFPSRDIDLWPFQFAKSLKYLSFPDTLCDFIFFIFMISWVYTRHYLYGYIILSMWSQSVEYIKYEFDPLNGKWFCRETFFLPILGLALLQLLILYWFVLILRIVFRMFSGKPAEDTRSDSEEWVLFLLFLLSYYHHHHLG